MHLNQDLAVQKQQEGGIANCTRIAVALCLLAFSSVYASASPVYYTGEDLNAVPGGSHPNSSAAAASFAAAAGLIGGVSTINFEGAPVGSFTSLLLAPGVTLTGTNINGAQQTINNTPNFAPNTALDGYNTTSGGSNYVEITGGTITFTFTTPIQFFGAYLQGIQTNFFQDTVTFSDGTSQSINVPGAGTDYYNGATDFIGFTDAGKSINSITIYAGNLSGADFLGLDDVMYQSSPVTAATPEPSSVVFLLTGCLGLAAKARQRWSN